MSIFDAHAKAAARAYFARESELAAQLEANPADSRAALDIARIQIPLDKPAKLMIRLASPAILDSLDPGVRREAGELLLEVGAYAEAKAEAERALSLSPDAPVHDLLAKAERAMAAEARLGVTPDLKRSYLTGMQRLVHGQVAWSAQHFEEVIAAAPRFVPAWIGLRGALEAEGDTAAVEALLERWVTAAPETAALARIVMGRRMTANGLLFDRRSQMPFRAMRETLPQVRTLDALRASPAAFLALDPGGQEVTLDPVIRSRRDGSDRILLNYRTPEVFIAGLDDAALVGRGVIVDAGGTVVRELHHPTLKKYGMADDGRHVGFDRVLFRSWLSEVKVHDTPALLMAGPTDNSFGDWMLSVMPRLAIARAAGLRCPVVVSAHAPEPFLELLRQVGLRDEDIIIHDPNGISLFRKLYVPSWPMREFLTPMSGLFEVFRDLTLPTKPGPGRRIYLSRERITRRGMVNETEVREIFERHGFEVIHPQDVPLMQMRQLLADADYVAAPYGSALLNLAMAGRKPKVIVFAPPLKLGFLRQAALWLGAMGLKFSYVLGEPVGELGRLDIKDYNWVAPIDRVEEALGALEHA